MDYTEAHLEYPVAYTDLPLSWNAVSQRFWYHPLTIVGTGVLCALPTILLRDYEQWDRKTFWPRLALHCLALYAVIAGAGYLFGWYNDTESFLSVSIIFFLVYAIVWLSGLWLDKQDEKKINRALDEIRDEE